MAITKRYRNGKNGYVTPYLDYHYEGKRWTETLTHLKYKAGQNLTLVEKHDAKEKKQLLQRIVKEKELKLLMGDYEIIQKTTNKEDFIAYLENYIKNYPSKNDARIYTSMYNWFKRFAGKSRVFAFEIDEAYLRRFLKYLEANLNYETPLTYFKKLRKVIRLATKENLFRTDPSMGIQVKINETRSKDILTQKEIELLISAQCPNIQVKNSFIFALYTGLRFVDINLLTWKNITDNNLSFIQHKTNEPVSMPLHPTAIRCMGKKKAPSEKIFCLPSHTGCLKSICKWVKNAEIDKHITFHTARHSFGSNLVENGVDISVTARLLGHKSLKHTMRYVRTSPTLKLNAINTLPIFSTTQK
ncbi:tyrosine-type recombinase/integrase [Ferruginibacter sp.]